MYAWRNMTPAMREEVLRLRKLGKQPWHGPPHGLERGWFHLSAACFEHKPIIGLSPERMVKFEREVRLVLRPVIFGIMAWCILPNHYHILLQCIHERTIRQTLGKLHGRLSRLWNREEDAIGRQCWHRLLLKPIKNDSHRWATLNYIHHNPVYHGYVQKWQEWPFSSAQVYLDQFGAEFVRKIWEEHPILEMGKGWDEADI